MKSPFRTSTLAGLFTAVMAASAYATSVTLDEFETTNNVTTSNVTSLSSIPDGTREVLQGTSSSTDPQVIFQNILTGLPAILSTSQFSQVQFTMYVDSAVTTNAVLYYTTDALPGFTAAKSATVDTSAYRGQYHTYTVNFFSDPNWGGSKLTGLRLDPFAQSGRTFKIDSLSVLSTAGDFSTAQPVTMNILWRDVVGTSDRKTVNTVAERKANHGEGEIFYAPATDLGTSNQKKLTRFYDSTSPTDYRDSTLGSLPGYVADSTMAYPWSGPHTGLAAVHEATSTSAQDFATVNVIGDSLLDGGTGYSVDSVLNGYAYARYDNSYNGISLTTLTAGGITASSNVIAGGAIWEWTWNGMQFINDADYGRQMQTSCFFKYNYGGSDKETNPTEAGSSAAGAANGTGANLFGSPNLVLFNIGNTQVSRSIPVEWYPPNLGGNTTTNPVLWPGVSLGKDLTLNYRGMNHVAKYVTTWHTPAALPGSASFPAQVEVPTVYLRGNLNTYYTYNAAANSGAGTLTAKSIPGYVAGSQAHHIDYSASYAGVIAATSDGSYAMGLYGVSTAQGGSVVDWTIWNFTTLGGTGQFDGGATKLGLVWNQTSGTFPAGDHVYTSYIVTGTLSDVTSAMHTLYTMRASIPQ